ncbi:MAG: hypothetical protein ACTSXX_02095 [Candidatus Baldrarchaeia archaeon]
MCGAVQKGPFCPNCGSKLRQLEEVFYRCERCGALYYVSESEISPEEREVEIVVKIKYEFGKIANAIESEV